MKGDKNIIKGVGIVIEIRNDFIGKAHENIVLFQLEGAVWRDEFSAALQNQMQGIIILAHRTLAHVGVLASIGGFQNG